TASSLNSSVYCARFALLVINVFSLREFTAQQEIRFSGASSRRIMRMHRGIASGSVPGVPVICPRTRNWLRRMARCSTT
ncbi:hypothetical protein LJ656_34540, partial [Paraburkholderia sp. MMS20-SJTR3]